MKTNPISYKLIFVGLLGLALLFHSFFVRAPLDFTIHTPVTIEEGSTVAEIAHLLESRNIIQSSAYFTFLIRTFGPEGGVRSGTYSFNKKLSVYGVADRVTTGVYGAPLIRVTIPEGSTVREINDILKITLKDFDSETFLDIAKPLEGYLFPDTYLFVESVTPEAVVEAMHNNFLKKLEGVQAGILDSGRSESEIIIMASILEKEARLYETRQTVAGILWKRLDIGMPLQVDAVFGYILDRDTFSPTFDQLEIDSPYNTYRNAGLPPGAISNPGLEAIQAAIFSKETPYLYYLTGADGRMHYGRTFEDHVANRRFLR